jgi:hypothetical protein
MWLSKKTYHIGSGCSQTVVRIFNFPLLIGKSKTQFYITSGKSGVGFKITTKPLFSVRQGYKKNIKLGKYYIVKL